jgi:hypothetical protein
MNIRLTTAFLVILFCLPVLAQNDIYMEQKVMTSGVMGQPARESINKSWISDNKIRQEGDRELMIMRFDLGKIWSVRPERKEYFEMTVEELKQLAKMGMMMMQNAEMKMDIKKTDQTKKIKDWNCYEVIVSSGMMTQHMWLTNDLPFKKNDFYSIYKNIPEFEELAQKFYNQKDLDGFPVYTEVEMNMMGQKIKSTSELISIQKKKNASDLFELPAGLKKIENPMKQMQQMNMEEQ